MKQTEHFGLNLMESADILSAKPLNANAETVDAVLQEQKSAILGRVMMAFGSYTGSGTRTVTIQTQGFKPQIVLMKSKRLIYGSVTSESVMQVESGWCLWIGADLAAAYEVYARADEVSGDNEKGDLRTDSISATITFSPEVGRLTWSVAARPNKYYDIRRDEGPSVVNNKAGYTYEWIAFGTAE